MLACECALACRLNQIVGLDSRTREPARKPPQPWQNSDQLIAETDAHRISAWNQMYRRFRQVLTAQFLTG
jgi:hypothetical protein